MTVAELIAFLQGLPPSYRVVRQNYYFGCDDIEAPERVRIDPIVVANEMGAYREVDGEPNAVKI